MTCSKLTAAAIMALTSISAQADIDVTFVESAPKDRFVVSNVGSCALDDLVVAIDLSTSVGGLIFDTTDTGAGVEVFQPFEVRSGEISLMTADRVQDGDTALVVRIAQLAAGASASFTIDVDDTLANSALGQIRVAGSEMEGATVDIMRSGGERLSSRFDRNSAALVPLSAC